MRIQKSFSSTYDFTNIEFKDVLLRILKSFSHKYYLLKEKLKLKNSVKEMNFKNLVPLHINKICQYSKF